MFPGLFGYCYDHGGFTLDRSPTHNHALALPSVGTHVGGWLRFAAACTTYKEAAPWLRDFRSLGIPAAGTLHPRSISAANNYTLALPGAMPPVDVLTQAAFSSSCTRATANDVIKT